jgi:hypothetical protein
MGTVSLYTAIKSRLVGLVDARTAGGQTGMCLYADKSLCSEEQQSAELSIFLRNSVSRVEPSNRPTI